MGKAVQLDLPHPLHRTAAILAAHGRHHARSDRRCHLETLLTLGVVIAIWWLIGEVFDKISKPPGPPKSPQEPPINFT